jgi:hypothetical protein
MDHGHAEMGHETVPYFYGNTPGKNGYAPVPLEKLGRYGLIRKRVAVTGPLRAIYGHATVHAISGEIAPPTMPEGWHDALPPQTNSPRTGSSVYVLPT